MISKTYEAGYLKEYKYVVILSEMKGKILLSRHKERSTWEMQGGHVEPGETPMAAAKRELYEESGAVDFYITPLCDYWAGTEDGKCGDNGMFFKAVIHECGAIPPSEMAEVKLFDTLPENLTYPRIANDLLRCREEHKTGFPSRKIAEMLLEEGAEKNPGNWVSHSRYVAMAAEQIAAKCSGMDADKAYVCGLLHDIGRRFGISQMAHIYNGYHYLMELGYPVAAQIALSHSFNLKKMDDYIGKCDISEEQRAELETLLENAVFDDYDYLIQLCDSIAKPEGIVSLEERMEDVKSRYGHYPQEKLDRNRELQAYFDRKAKGCER